MTRDHPPLWLQLLFGLVPLPMALALLGAWFGVVPTGAGTFVAPPLVIFALSSGLILFALLMWVPREAPRAIRFGLPVALLLSIAVVCNWTAFAPNLRYTSQVAIGPWSSRGEDAVGGRIAFGLAALAVDALIVLTIAQAIRSRGPRR